MSKITYIKPDTIIDDKDSVSINNDVLQTDIDDVDYSKYSEDDSDEEYAEKFDY